MKGLRYIGYATIGLVSLLVVVVGSLWMFPKMYWNPSVLERLAAKASLKVSNIRAEVAFQNWRERVFSLGWDVLEGELPGIKLSAQKSQAVIGLTLGIPLRISIQALSVDKITADVVPSSDEPSHQSDAETSNSSLSWYVVEVDGKVTVREFHLGLDEQKTWTMQGSAKGDPESGIQLSTIIVGPDQRFELQGHGKPDEQGARGEFSADLGRRRELSLKECRWKAQDLSRLQVELGCTALVRPEKLGLGQWKSVVGVKPEIDLALNVKFRPDFLGLDGGLTAKLPVARSTLEAELKGEFGGDFDEEIPQWRKHWALQAKVHDFAALTRALKGTPFAVPAPFNVFSGTISAEASLKQDLPGTRHLAGASRESIVVKASTDLKSAKQVLVNIAEGVVSFSGTDYQNPHVKFDLITDDAELYLPALRGVSSHAFVPDTRFIPETEKPEPSQKKAAKLTLDGTLRSGQRPARLHLAELEQAVPLEWDLRVRSDSVRGRVKILPLNLRVLGRRTQVRYFTLQLAADPKFSELDGRIEFLFSEGNVFLDTKGTVETPQFILSSKPPLPKDEIISLLLYGKKKEVLSFDQRDSVHSAEAAIEDSAVSLASMYLLASTPVESIGYNPSTGVVTARVRLNDGTSMNIGSNARDLNEVGLTHRLGGNWSLRTYVEDPLSPVRRSFSAFLEWSRGY